MNKYYPYGYRRNSTGDLGTDKLFTGQRLDSTGLYYYGARYYDPNIGRFISADAIIPDPMNPQAFNRYTYVINNPLKYIDPTGRQWDVWVSAEDLISIGQGSSGSDDPDDWETELALHKGRDEWGYDVTYGKDPRGSGERIPMLTPREGGRLDLVLGDIFGFTEARARKAGKINASVPFFQEISSAIIVPREGQRHYGKHDAIDWTTQDAIILCDAIAVAGDFVSLWGGPALPIGYTVSAIGGSISYGLTVSEYRNGNITRNDMLRAHINWTTGFVPGWGFIPAGIQTWFDWSR